MSPEFRRLSEVRLININSPSLAALADVRRYSHTLGVLRLALANPMTNFGKEEYRALLASIIVHDAGTPAFAHLFEYQLKDHFDWDHESVVPRLLVKTHHVDQGSHQIFSARRPEFEALCRKSKVDFQLVLAILEQRHPCSKLVFGSIDFDNLDNVARMNWMLGETFNLDIILQLASSLGADAITPLLLPESQRANVLRWLSLRRRAYEVLVFDGPTVAGQAVLSELISDALRTRSLSVEDWHYTDQQLLDALKTSPGVKERLERDFFGPTPELRLIAHITDISDPIFRRPKGELYLLIKEFLQLSGVSRTYGYCLVDRGTFEKRIAAVDPDTGKSWSVGERSESLILYGFGRGGRHSPAADNGREFLKWIESVGR